MSPDSLFLPFHFVFMQKAFLVAALISVPAAMLSCFLVLKGWALMGDAVSHAVLPGVVLAYAFGLPIIIGAFVAGMTCAVVTGYLSENSRIEQDTIMGVVFSGMFGIGLILLVVFPIDIPIDHILFGNILGIDQSDLVLSGLISLAVCTILIAKWKDVFLYCFDAAQARLCGLPLQSIHFGLLAILSLTVVATLSAVGIILAIGLLIAPGAIAFLLVRQFHHMLWVSVLVCLLATFFGIYLSFFVDSAPAPTIILLLTFAFIFTFIWRRTSLSILKPLSIDLPAVDSVPTIKMVYRSLPESRDQDTPKD
ncbi:MAG: metal ABC transporter permease [Aestuariivita sp.]|nr:metal ABC transporter permease [Aestuariivita sp.]MCY4346311.1 metal ABC transporter permease [Aestuariivita sp.]